MSVHLPVVQNQVFQSMSFQKEVARNDLSFSWLCRADGNNRFTLPISDGSPGSAVLLESMGMSKCQASTKPETRSR